MSEREAYIIINEKRVTPENLREQNFPDESVSEFLELWWNKDETIPLQTSGSTGEAKIIRSPKKFLIESARLTIEKFQLKENDLILLCLSAKYIAGRMMLIRALTGNLKVKSVDVTSNPFDELSKEKISFAAMVPLQVYTCFENKQEEKINRIEKLIIGGGEISSELQRKISRLENECFATYGMTETYSHIAIRKLNPPVESFTLLNGIKAWYDERSCLVIDAPVLGVHQLITNDLVEFTDLNKFIWIGRYDNIINTGGIKISPELVEKKLGQFINRRFFIDKLPDKQFGEKVVLVIEGEPFDNYTAGLFESHLKRILEKAEVPKKILFIQKFDETGTGKIQRKKTMQRLIS